MKFFLSTIILTFFLFVFVAKADDFCIKFYKEPNYQVYAGIICGQIDVGGSAGAKSGNMSVGSFEAPSFLQVTLYEERYYRGQYYVYKGAQESISPAVHVGSVKWKYL